MIRGFSPHFTTCGFPAQFFIDKQESYCIRGLYTPNYRVHRIRNFFFIRLEANLSEYGSYSLHIRMFRYIRKQHLFAPFASYSLQNKRTDSRKYLI
jgi:hypothetical protein